MTLFFHTLCIYGDFSGIVKNHVSYCNKHEIKHHTKVIGNFSNNLRSKLLWKINNIQKILNDSTTPEDTIHIFCDDLTIIYNLNIKIENCIKNNDYWISQPAPEKSGDLSFCILKKNENSRKIIDQLFAAINANTSSSDSNQYQFFNIEPNQKFDELIDGCYANFLFFPFSSHLDKIEPFILNLDSKLHGFIQDWYSTNIFIEKLNVAQSNAQRLFDLLPEVPPLSDYEVINPGGKLAIILLYTSNIIRSAQYSEKSLVKWSAKHNYALYIYRHNPNPAISPNWLKAELILKHLPMHDCVGWIDSDVMIVDYDKDISSFIKNQSILFTRDITGWELNSGIMFFSNCDDSYNYLNRVNEIISSVADKQYTYSSGGDQKYFCDVWKEFGGDAFVQRLDCSTLNSHPVLMDQDSTALHFMGFSENLRALAMQSIWETSP